MMPEYRPTPEMDAWDKVEEKLREAWDNSDTMDEYREREEVIRGKWDKEKREKHYGY